MSTKQHAESQRIDDLIRQIIDGSRLFLSGGQESSFIALKEGVEDAAKQVLNRLYPRFNDGDSAKWPQVLKKAKEGSANALTQVGFTGDPQTHPVAAAITSFIGSGATGLEIRKKFTGAGYGWPQDAIDAVLTTLLASNHLSARINTNPLMLAEVDQTKLRQATFRLESPVLTALQKLALRKLFQESGFPKITPGNETVDAIRFIEHAKAIAVKAGGEAPAPMAPSAPEITALESYSGNELLMQVYDQREQLLDKIKAWQETGEKIAKRLPAFLLTEKLVAQASGLPDKSAWSATITAIRANRSLLDDPDPVSNVITTVTNALRAALSHACKTYGETFEAQKERIQNNPVWQKLSDEKQQALLSSAGAIKREVPVTDTDEKLLNALDSCSLANWQSRTDALAAQFGKALANAIIEAEPKARRISLSTATIHDPAELEAWLHKSKIAIEAALKDGPVIL